MGNKDSGELLLYLDAAADFCPTCGVRSNEQGKTLNEVITELNWSKDRATKAIKDAEDHGMIKGDWGHHPDKEWVRRFYISGEGTRNYIETLKKCLTLGEGDANDGSIVIRGKVHMNEISIVEYAQMDLKVYCKIDGKNCNWGQSIVHKRTRNCRNCPKPLGKVKRVKESDE